MGISRSYQEATEHPSIEPRLWSQNAWVRIWPPPMTECIGLLGLSVQTEKLSGLINRNVLSQSSGGWKSKVRVSAGWFFLRTLRENLFQASLPASGGLLAIRGILCVCLCPDFPFL